MKNYWINWITLTFFKAVLLTGCVIGSVGGIIHFSDYGLLAILFVPLSVFLLYDFTYQLLIPFIGGIGNRFHKPSDTPIFMGLAPSYKGAKEIIKKRHCIIWS